MTGGTAGQPKIIRPETPGQRATVRGLTKFLVPFGASDLILQDVDIRGSHDAGGGNLFHVNGARVMLDGVDISWPRNICLGVGANGQPAKDFVLIDSRIHDCGSTHDNDPNDPGGAHGAYLQFVDQSADDADGWGAVVYNSLFDHNDGRGLQLYPDVDDILVDHVVLYGNGSNLNIGADSPTVRSEGNQIRNTILAKSRLDYDDPVDPNPTSTNEVVGYFPLESHNGADNRLVDSCVSNTVKPEVPLISVTSNGNSLAAVNVTLDQPPTFVDVAARDFRITAGSTCQGMGLTDASRLPGGPDVTTTAPAAPTVTGSSPSGGAVSVSFTPGSNGGSPITGFTVSCVSTDGGVTRARSGTASPVQVTGLTGGFHYRCRVRATNAVGTGPYSGYGATVLVPTTAPAAPTVKGSSPSGGAVSVSFTPGSDGGSPITGFTVSCVSTDGGVTRARSGTASPVQVTGLTGGFHYRCRVRATNAVGTGPYSGYGATVLVPTTAPAAPTVKGSSPSGGAVSVSFTPGSDGGSPITGFTVSCVSTDGGVTRARSGTASPVQVTGLTGGFHYRCRVRATNAVGTGPYSGYGATVLVPTTAPAAPTVKGSSPSGGAVSVSFTPGSDGGSPITGFTVSCVSTDGGVTRARSGTASPVQVTGLTGGFHYRCRVRATNAVGTGPYSAYGATVLVL